MIFSYSICFLSSGEQVPVDQYTEVAKQHDVYAGAIAFGVLALFLDWIKKIGNSSSAKNGTCSPDCSIADYSITCCLNIFRNRKTLHLMFKGLPK